MTVRELIDRLWTLPANTDVLTPDGADIFVHYDVRRDTVFITDVNPDDSMADGRIAKVS